MSTNNNEKITVQFVAPSAPTWAAFVQEDGTVSWERIHLWCCRIESWARKGYCEDPFNSSVIGMSSYGPGIGYGVLGETSQSSRSFLGYFCHMDVNAQEFQEMLLTWKETHAAEAKP